MLRFTVAAAHDPGRSHRILVAAIAAALALTALLGATAIVPVSPAQAATTYENPLPVAIPGDGMVESCADPSVIYGHDGIWYMYCTTDPLNSADRNAEGGFNFHKIPMLSSADLVTWTYRGDAFETVPAWGEPTAGMWAPEITRVGDTYYLFYGITDVTDETSGEPNCAFDNAIGVATSDHPLGPWVDQGEPVVEPRRGGPGCNFFWTFDPDVLTAGPGVHYLYYGSYYGGVFVRPLTLTPDGASTDPATAVQVAIPNRYEGPEVVFHDGYYYIFLSATDCCRGPLTGYSVFAGRSLDPLGPFVDREGVALNPLPDGRVGGTPVISMNGNRWVGPGHNSVFVDFDGQWWTAYHAIDRFDPYFADAVGFTKRPVLLDPLDWVDGWPTVRGGYWASDEPMPGPAAQPGETTAYEPVLRPDDEPGAHVGYATDNFTSPNLHPRWSWVRGESADWSLENGTLRFATQPADLHVDNNSASVLTMRAPRGDYLVETRVRLTVPPGGCCFNFVQAGLVVYGDDDNYLKLVHVSIWETRQTEFAKELAPVPEGYPRYGNTVVGPPADWTYLRIVKRTVGAEEHYSAYSSQDGERWVRGGTWTHALGEGARIGLVSMGGAGFEAFFDYVRTYRLRD